MKVFVFKKIEVANALGITTQGLDYNLKNKLNKKFMYTVFKQPNYSHTFVYPKSYQFYFSLCKKYHVNPLIIPLLTKSKIFQFLNTLDYINNIEGVRKYMYHLDNKNKTKKQTILFVKYFMSLGNIYNNITDLLYEYDFLLSKSVYNDIEQFITKHNNLYNEKLPNNYKTIPLSKIIKKCFDF